MRLFVQAVILGLLAGGVYALMASGLTLAFGIMRVINVAQGVMIILGAYLSYTVFTHFSVDPFLSVLFVVPVVFALGVVIELVFIRPLRPSDREELSLLVTWAVALGIEGVLGLVYSTTYRSTIPSYANRAWRIGGFAVLQVQVYAFALSIVILAGLGGEHLVAHVTEQRQHVVISLAAARQQQHVLGVWPRAATWPVLRHGLPRDA